MNDKLNEILDLERQMSPQKDPLRRKLFDVDFLRLAVEFDIDYPENLKIIAQEIGFGRVTPIQADFYDCLNDSIHYKTNMTPTFIKALLEFGISVAIIDDLEFDFSEKTFHNKEIDDLHDVLSEDFDCVDIAVNTFDDTYNCSIVLVLTGAHRGMVCYDEWRTIEHLNVRHNFSSFNPIALLEDYIIAQRKQLLAVKQSPFS